MSENGKLPVKAEEKPAANLEGKSYEFVPLGSSDKIRLTAAMVRAFIAVKTKKGCLPSEADCIRFIMLCKGKRANPFEGDCYLLGYDTDDGPKFSMVCGIDLFLKRAEQEPDFDGAESGVIICREDGALEERPGSLVLGSEKLAGGWSRVWRKGRRIPEYKSVKFSTYDTGRSRWKADPGGMIEKVARSQALRAAFPTPLGGLYAREEMDALHESGRGLIGIEGQVQAALDAADKPEVLPEDDSPNQDQPDQPDQNGQTEAPSNPLPSKKQQQLFG